MVNMLHVMHAWRAAPRAPARAHSFARSCTPVRVCPIAGTLTERGGMGGKSGAGLEGGGAGTSNSWTRVRRDEARFAVKRLDMLAHPAMRCALWTAPSRSGGPGVVACYVVAECKWNRKISFLVAGNGRSIFETVEQS